MELYTHVLQPYVYRDIAHRAAETCKYVLFVQVHSLTSLIKNRALIRSAAQMTSFSPPYGDDKQRRVANDGTAYTFDEFSNYYGIWCEAYWSAAAPTIPQNNVEKLSNGGAEKT